MTEINSTAFVVLGDDTTPLLKWDGDSLTFGVPVDGGGAGGLVATTTLTTHKTSSDHDGRYYTETELNNGQLNNLYYTESEVNVISGVINGKIPTVSGYSGSVPTISGTLTIANGLITAYA